MFDCDRLIIGGGVIGLAVARAFADRGDSVLLIECNANFGMETSSRNSEVIHAGIYYPSHSLKAHLCAKGARALHAYCEARGVPLARHGKLIVATPDQSNAARLMALKTQGDANGVLGLEIIDKPRLKSLEPELNAEAALYSPMTSVVDAHALMAALEADAINNAATIAYRTRFVKAQPTKQNKAFRVAVTNTTPSNTDGNTDSNTDEITHITTRTLINCAGHSSRSVSLAIEGIDPTSIPPHYIAKGQYFTTTRRPPFRHLIYPLPDQGGLGIHLTLDCAGGSRFGPDIRWLAKNEKADYAVNPKDAKIFWQSITRYWADLKPEELVPAWAGLRPKTVASADQFQDFIIHHARHHKCPGVVALYGIDSPGLSASLAIAEYVKQLASE